MLIFVKMALSSSHYETNILTIGDFWDPPSRPFYMKFCIHALTKMKRLLQCCGSVAATMQQLDMYATTGGDKVAN